MNDDWKKEFADRFSYMPSYDCQGVLTFIESLLQKQRDEFVDEVKAIRRQPILDYVDEYCDQLVNKLIVEGIK